MMRVPHVWGRIFMSTGTTIVEYWWWHRPSIWKLSHKYLSYTYPLRLRLWLTTILPTSSPLTFARIMLGTTSRTKPCYCCYYVLCDKGKFCICSGIYVLNALQPRLPSTLEQSLRRWMFVLASSPLKILRSTSRISSVCAHETQCYAGLNCQADYELQSKNRRYQSQNAMPLWSYCQRKPFSQCNI